MCDTIVALGNSTTDGKVLFAKNSDREPNEAHELVIIPGSKHQKGDTVKCTYIEIPQVEETFQVLLAKPFWIWGAEMGANEFNVTIGNEAVFTKDRYGKEPGLIGMDFLRLALERSKTAHDALLTITDLLEKFSQSGNCGFAHEMYYHNSFLICDPDEAWVLETSARHWAAKKVKDVGSISNAITIEDEWDMASTNLIGHAVEKGWCKDAKSFNFSKCYSEPVYTLFSDARNRQSCTIQQLKTHIGQIDPAMMMEVLRTHRENSEGDFSPDRGITGADVCMHAGWGPIRGSQTTGSMVSQLDKNGSIHWLTGSAAPCTSLFKPVWMDSGLPDVGGSPQGVFDDKTLFWSHEMVHRLILEDYQVRINLIKPEQRDFEQSVLKEVQKNKTKTLAERKTISVNAFAKARGLELKWLKKFEAVNRKHQNRLLYKQFWKNINKAAKLIIS